MDIYLNATVKYPQVAAQEQTFEAPTYSVLQEKKRKLKKDLDSYNKSLGNTMQKSGKRTLF